MKGLVSVLVLISVLCLAVGCTAQPVESGSSQVDNAATSTSATTSSSATSSSATQQSTTSATEPVTAPPVVEDVWNPTVMQRQVLLDEGSMCGVVYIGFVEGEAGAEECISLFCNSGYAEDFGLSDIPESNVVDTGYANELYLIVPYDENATVSVNEWLLTEENDYMGENGQVFYRSEYGSPVLLKCNFSDIMPNSVVNIVDSEGNTLSWSPSISLKDGSVSRYGVEDKVYDFTAYIYNETYECYQIVPLER